MRTAACSAVPPTFVRAIIRITRSGSEGLPASPASTRSSRHPRRKYPFADTPPAVQSSCEYSKYAFPYGEYTKFRGPGSYPPKPGAKSPALAATGAESRADDRATRHGRHGEAGHTAGARPSRAGNRYQRLGSVRRHGNLLRGRRSGGTVSGRWTWVFTRYRDLSQALPNFARLGGMTMRLRRERPDIVHAFLFHSLYHRRASRPDGPDSGIRGRSSQPREFQGGSPGGPGSRAADHSLHRPHRRNAVAVAEDTKQRERVGDDKVEVVYNGLPEQAFAPVSPARSRPPIRSCSAWRTSRRYKGHRYLLEALSRLQNGGHPCTLQAGRDGQEREPWSARRHGCASTSGFSANAKMCAPCSRERMSLRILRWKKE